jgi:hypothetical protein
MASSQSKERRLVDLPMKTTLTGTFPGVRSRSTQLIAVDKFFNKAWRLHSIGDSAAPLCSHARQGSNDYIALLFSS